MALLTQYTYMYVLINTTLHTQNAYILDMYGK